MIGLSAFAPYRVIKWSADFVVPKIFGQTI